MDAGQGTLGTLGPYVLESVLGRGGMGVVYRARDTRRGRVVALKLLAEYLATDERFVSRFRRESRIAAQLNDPHVIPIHDFGEIDGRLFIDMRFVEGIDVAQLLYESGTLPVRRAVEILAQVSGALDAAHRDGLVHRDIKPANILLAGPVDPARTPFAYLVDFGIARAAASAEVTEISTTTNTVGTISYMAPERLVGQPGDHHTDIYSLGCVLYELITGHKPFEGEPAALMYAHINTAPPDPRAVVPSVPQGVAAAIATAMAKNPADRFPTAGAFADAALAALSADEVPTDAGVSHGGDSTVRYADPHPAAPAPPQARPRPEDATTSFRVPDGAPGRPPVPGPVAAHAPFPGGPIGPQQGQPPARRRRRAPWVVAGALVVAAAVVVAVVLSMQSNDATPQGGGSGGNSSSTKAGPTGGPQHAQFASAQLYALARPFVEHMTCVDNPSADEAPLASTVPHVELVKCTGAQYSATFMSFENAEQFLAGRVTYLGKAVHGSVRTVAARPDHGPEISFARSYRRAQGDQQAGRVYWESRGTLCSAELQAVTGQSPQTMVDYWRTR